MHHGRKTPISSSAMRGNFGMHLNFAISISSKEGFISTRIDKNY
jgi:hypothetical protein